jgi:hypothetical protein
MTPKTSLTATVMMTLSGCASTHAVQLSQLPLKTASNTTERGAIAVVRVPLPWYAPRFSIVSKFVDSLPQYSALPGLFFKAYTISDERQFGGVYWWNSRATAEAWFNEAWHARVKKVRGVDGDVLIFDVVETVDGPDSFLGERIAPSAVKSQTSIAVVTLSGLSDTQKSTFFSKVSPHLQKALGLVRSSLVTSASGQVGVVTLFASRPAAEAFWTQPRIDDLNATAATQATLAWFASPLLLDNVKSEDKETDARAPAPQKAAHATR